MKDSLGSCKDTGRTGEAGVLRRSTSRAEVSRIVIERPARRHVPACGEPDRNDMACNQRRKGAGEKKTPGLFTPAPFTGPCVLAIWH